MKKVASLLLVVLVCSCVYSQNIRLNQIGFHPSGYKVAVVPENAMGSFNLIDANSGTPVYSAELGESVYWVPAGASVKIAEFTDFEVEGTYYIQAGGESSHQFEISKNIYEEPLRGLARAFYYWRSSTSIDAPHSYHGGVDFSRAMGHPDNAVVVDGSAASPGRPSGTTFNCSKGWYDAGDYGKYVVTAGPSAFYFLTAVDQLPLLANDVDLNIPESSDNVPDLLNEAKWELDWLLKMQDPYDGGVYFQLTTQGFAGMGDSPAADGATRYVYKKTTPSSLSVAAVMALASRVFSKYESEFPGYASQCLATAESAWQWALSNPNVAYNSAGGTGQYEDDNGDVSFHDEFAWAANELFITTGDANYYSETDFLNEEYCVLEEPSWQKTSGFGLLSLMNNIHNLNDVANKQAIINKFMNFTDSLWNIWESSGYKVMTDRYWWGINAVVGTQGVFFFTAYNHTGNVKYLNAAISQLDYIYGRNPTGYSYVTWYGDHTPMHPHDRRSISDGISAPLPGYVVAGAMDNCLNCDGVATHYEDNDANFEKNEIAINFNAPNVYLAACLSSVFKYKGSSITGAETGIVKDSSITLFFNRPLIDSTVVGDLFTLVMDGNTVAVDTAYLLEDGKSVKIILSEVIEPTDYEIYISYADTSILAVDRNPLLSFENYRVQNDLPGAPLQVIRTEVDESGLAIKITVDKNVGMVDEDFSNYLFEASGFRNSISDVTFSGTTVTVHLSDIINAGQLLIFEYKGLGIIAEDTGILPPFGPILLENPFQTQAEKAKGFRDDMNDEDYTLLWSPTGNIVLEENTDTLIVHCNNTGGYDHLIGRFDPLDVSANPTLQIALKAPTNVWVRIDIGSFDGNQMVYTNTESISFELEGGNWDTLVYEFTNFSGSWPEGMVNPEIISQVNIMFNAPDGYGEDVLIDFIQLGDYEAPKSHNAFLSFMATEHPYFFNQGFDSLRFSYTIDVEHGTPYVPTIYYQIADDSATVEYIEAETLSDTTYIIVTAHDGYTRIQYSVAFNEYVRQANQTYTITEGWNYIAINVQTEPLIISDLLANELAGVVEVRSEDGFYNMNNLPQFNSISELEYGTAYILYSDSNITFERNGILPLNRSVYLTEGWNYIALPIIEDVTVENAFSRIWWQFEELKNNEGKYVKNGTENTLIEIVPGKGYFLRVNTDCELHY